MAVGHADDGLAEITVAKPTPAHGAVGRTGYALSDRLLLRLSAITFSFALQVTKSA